VLLPLRLNDGTPVPDDAVTDTLIELEERFGAVSCETQTIRGRWRLDAESFRDDLIRVFVDVPDLPESRQFFVEYKEKLKARFQQLEIWMTTHLTVSLGEPVAHLQPFSEISANNPPSQQVFPCCESCCYSPFSSSLQS